ncbi:uncharacterized protein LOC121718060 isoform X2 [Alosa sapidissima]|nr:uncharacterized protein LOC121718060 isoform X2 [Alosa sapidissima]
MCLEDAPSEANGTFKCLSSRPIAFRPVPGSVRHSPGYNAQSHLPIILRDRACTTCGTPIVETQLSTAVEVPLITRNFVFDCKVLSTKCCEESRPYDGMEDAIINMGTYLISHEVMRDYMYHFLQTGVTMFGYFHTWKNHLEDSGCQVIPLTYHKFRVAWYAFVDLLDLSFEAGFECARCGPTPHTIICDGTALSFRRALLPWQELLPHLTTTGSTLRGSSHKDRVFVPEPRGRLLLAQYVERQLSREETEELPNKVPISLRAVLECSPQQCPDNLKGLIRALSKNSPACGLLHPSAELQGFLERIATGYPVRHSVDDMLYLQQQVPVLFQMLKDTEDNHVPTLLGSLLLDLFSKAEAPFLGEELVDDSPVEASLSFFPSLPVIRQRGHYLADSKQSKPACHKNASGHPSLLPGVFLIHCEHGICYGFQMMVKHESPDTPFTVLKPRFMEIPKVVIYDNSCNLHQYCLNRDPLSFKKTWFLVDRLHWKNH